MKNILALLVLSLCFVATGQDYDTVYLFGDPSEWHTDTTTVTNADFICMDSVILVEYLRPQRSYNIVFTTSGNITDASFRIYSGSWEDWQVYYLKEYIQWWKDFITNL